MEKTPASSYIVRFNDCDPLGHLNNSKYIDYFINAREDHLRDFYQIDLKEWARQGIGFVVTRHEIRYIRPAFYNERVTIQSSLIDKGDSWIQVELTMWDESRQTLKAIIWTRFTRVDPQTGKRADHPEEFTEKFVRPLLVEEAGAEKGMDARLAVLLQKNRP